MHCISHPCYQACAHRFVLVVTRRDAAAQPSYLVHASRAARCRARVAIAVVRPADSASASQSTRRNIAWCCCRVVDSTSSNSHRHVSVAVTPSGVGTSKYGPTTAAERLSRAGSLRRSGKIGYHLRTRGSRFQRHKSPALLYTTCSPPPWGSLTPAPACGADAGRLWHGGTRTEGAHSGGSSTDSSNRSLHTQTDRCRGRRTSCGRPLVPQAQRAPQCRRSKPPYPFPGLLPRLAAGRIAEAAAASTTKGRSDGGLARKKARLYARGVLTYPQGKPLKPSYVANRLPGPP